LSKKYHPSRTKSVKITKRQKGAIAKQLASFFFDFWEKRNKRKRK